MHHFGEPLVASTTDFGVRTEPPFHRELLDWLAADFMRSGWSVKHLHRVIMLSSAYQQGSANSNPLDPENKLLSHFSRQRLDFEATRDSLLFVSGQLDSTIGGRPVEITANSLNCRRTIYGLVDRQNLPSVYRVFDFPIPDQCVERRPQTTVPQQALFNLNSPFVMEQANILSTRPEIAAKPDSRDRLKALYLRVLGRPPSPSEMRFGITFIDNAHQESGQTPWELLAHVLLISNEFVFLD
jgi:hypothetical protein